MEPSRESKVRPIAACVATAALLLSGVAISPAPLGAQLRPLDPLDWDALESPKGLSLRLGLGAYSGQEASLAGTRGRLLEVGSFAGTWRSGRVALQASGTAMRFFRDDAVFAAPVEGTRRRDGDARTDVGDQRISTILRLTDGAGSWDAALRFGVRLPTTDDREGLERDRTDFFATVAGRRRVGALRLSAELGVGVWGTRDSLNEQVDPLLFALSTAYDLGWLRPDLTVVGQHDTRRNSAKRGNEDLGELRVGATRGEDRWVRLGVVRGWQTFSPDWGLTLEAGLRY